MAHSLRLIRRPLTAFLIFLCWFPPSGAAAADPEPIRVGATVSRSGKYTEPSAMVEKGFRVWAAGVNGRGGILGRRVELILHDDESDPDQSARLYERLITRERVDLLLSPYGTPLTMAASEVSERHRMVMVACAASGTRIWERGFRYIFGIYSLADRYFIGMLDLMAREGLENLAILYENSPFNQDVAKGAMAWAKRFGIRTVYQRSFDPHNPELAPMVDAAAKITTDGLVISAYPEEGYRLLELMSARHFRPRALGVTIIPVHPDFLSRAGPIGDGVFGPSQWEPDERIPFPGTQQFIADFRGLTGIPPSYHAGSAFAACQIIEKAVTGTNSMDQEKMRDLISRLDTVTVIGRFKVDATGRQIGHNPILIQWQNGRKEIVYPTKMQTAPPKF